MFAAVIDAEVAKVLFLVLVFLLGRQIVRTKARLDAGANWLGFWFRIDPPGDDPGKGKKK